MAVGNAKGLFNESTSSDLTGGKEKSVSVKGHNRTRVIGGPSKTVSATSYTYMQYPSSGNSLAAGGEEVLFAWDGSDGWWTGRVNGPLWRLADFLEKTVSSTAFFKAKGGRSYGPFNKNE